MAVIIKSGSSGTFLVVNTDGSINVVLAGTLAADVADRAARVLGHVVVDNFPLVQSVFGVVDVTDRAARLVGHVTVDNFPSVGATRTNVTLYADRVAGRTTEALETLTINVGGVVTTGSSYTVTSGKTFRITSLQVEILNTGGGTNRVTVRVRSAAAVALASPVIIMGLAAAASDKPESGGQDGLSFPDGIEIAAGQQIGISQLCVATTAGIVSFLLQGYEF